MFAAHNSPRAMIGRELTSGRRARLTGHRPVAPSSCAIAGGNARATHFKLSLRTASLPSAAAAVSVCARCKLATGRAQCQWPVPSLMRILIRSTEPRPNWRTSGDSRVACQLQFECLKSPTQLSARSARERERDCSLTNGHCCAPTADHHHHPH